MAAAEMVVRDAVFAYTDPDGVQRMAIRGEAITVDGADLERGQKFGSFFLEEDLVEVTGPLDGALVGDDEDLDGLVTASLLDVLRQRLGLPEDADPADVVAAVGEELLGPVEPVADELSSTGVVDGEVPESDSDTERPARAALKQAWIDYVVDLGADLAWASAEDTTKDDLQAWTPPAAPAAPANG